MSSNPVRNAIKKFNTYEAKHPGVIDDNREKLRRDVIIAKLVETKREDDKKKVAERLLVATMTEEEVLEEAFQQNAPLNVAKNLDIKKKKKNKKNNDRKKRNKQKKKQENVEAEKTLHVEDQQLCVEDQQLCVQLAIYFIQKKVDAIKEMKVKKCEEKRKLAESSK